MRAIPFLAVLGTTCIYSPRAIERILNRVLVWAGYGDATAFVKQNEIQLGIDESYRELSVCSDRFAVRPFFFTFYESLIFLKNSP